MVSIRTCQALFLGTLLLATSAFAARTPRAATSGNHHSSHHSRRHARKHEVRGQRQIEPDRAREIQEALIREHYLTPPASGQWDNSTEAAMQKYQSDHGWQTRLTPDSRALIKLGLGPRAEGAPAAEPTAQSVAPAEGDDNAAGNPSASTNTLADAHSLPN